MTTITLDIPEALAERLVQHRERLRWKGSDLSAIDSATGMVTSLFNPRAHVWQEHFALAGAQIVGLTSVGRATVALLQFNEPRRVIQRRVLIDVGRYPPHA